MTGPLKIVVLGLSITSSWGNGHATTYRGLIRELEKRGHQVTFLERDVPWYAENRDLPDPPFGKTFLYSSVEELKDSFISDIREADCVIVGSYVPQGIDVGDWVTSEATGVTAFYDIDTPVTLAELQRGRCEYVSLGQIAGYDLYLSFTGGPTLKRIENEFGSPSAKPLYCSVDAERYFPEQREPRWDLGYMGTYSVDRQPIVDKLLLEPARRNGRLKFAVAGPQYPNTESWPSNVDRIEHLPPSEHRGFYNSQRYTLNVTRTDMIRAGFSPSVRLFEAAACGVPIISDYWEGLDSFFALGTEIVVAKSADEVLNVLKMMSEDTRQKLGKRGRDRVLMEHTAEHRAEELETYLLQAAASVNTVAA